MSFGYDDKFEADPGRLQSFLDENERVAKSVRSMGHDFVADLEPYSNWYGIDDEFAKEAGPQYRKDVDSVRATFTAIGAAVAGISGGRLQEIMGIKKAQNFAMDNMQEAKAATHNVGESGSGKH
ncbi:hypothetical protein [Streptomyces cucumeris]|uniref:hypothetical protein n=1 Tax=Streptomyces cucumeris TaxID=2962890 RepID=UPI0020C90C1D|nr:hypothetical protein [Streptomyces sp. NEAU-Y11]MCP9206517.1 hypothetical protein [Streptomyces sp. NEAU-Y11]